MQMKRRLFNRRSFVATGAVAGMGTAAWMSMSSSWTARFLRERFAEWGRAVPAAPHKPTPATWNDNGITLSWLGHATVLINFYGVRIITDPVLYSRIGVDVGVGSIGPLRLVQCALAPEELPEIDLVLVSHAHFDHLDTPSLAAVRGRPAAVMAWETSDLLPRSHYSSVSELRWNDATRVQTPRGDVVVRAIEVKHWGARVQRDTHRGYAGFVVEREGRRLLIGGDTASTEAFRQHRQLGPFEAAVMPIGAYDPWIRNHCTPEQAVTMADAARARLFVPVHHQSFQLSREPFAEPIERTQQALAAEADRLALREIGETRIVLA
jgi:L-ascorbate metabolism protein UlaG (beta-lactamase superfamily)